MQQGLGEMGMGQPQMGGQEDPNRALIEKVKEALMKGASPEELLQAGVEQAILEQAIMELQNEMAQEQPTPGQGQGAPMNAGLAAQGMI